MTMGRPRAARSSSASPTRAPPTRRCWPTTCAATRSLPTDQGSVGDGAQALRYDKLPAGEGQSATVFAVPNFKGVATLACVAEDATCAKIASSMRITDGNAFPVGPNDEYAGKLESTLTKLEKSEKSAATDLRNANKRATQVSATSRLAAAYGAAASTLAKVKVSPADAALNAATLAGLRDARDAYKKAASAGNAKSRSGYDRDEHADDPRRHRARGTDEERERGHETDREAGKAAQGGVGQLRHVSDRGRLDQRDDEADDHRTEDRNDPDGRVLAADEGDGSLEDRAGHVLHRLGPLVPRQHVASEISGEQDRDDARDRDEPQERVGHQGLQCLLRGIRDAVVLVRGSSPRRGPGFRRAQPLA